MMCDDKPFDDMTIEELRGQLDTWSGIASREAQSQNYWSMWVARCQCNHICNAAKRNHNIELITPWPLLKEMWS